MLRKTTLVTKSLEAEQIPTEFVGSLSHFVKGWDSKALLSLTIPARTLARTD